MARACDGHDEAHPGDSSYVSAENAAFVEQNCDKITAMLKKMQAENQ
jgi:hypothetical protein